MIGALELLGLSEDTPEVEGGVIGRDATGRLTGIFKDVAKDMALGRIPVPSDAANRRAIAREYAGPHALLLNFGAFDGVRGASYERYGDGDRYMLTGPEMDAFWASYLGDDWATLPPDPMARPLHADLSALPPTWLCTARCDILLDENAAMAERLEAAGVAAEMHIYDGATHSFLEAASVSRIADRALAEAPEWLRDRLA